MKKYFSLLIATGISLLSMAQSDKAPYLTKSLANQTVSNVKVETSGGSISVAGVSTAEAKIEVYVTGNNNGNLSKEEIDKRLSDDYTLDVSFNNGKLTAIAKNKSYNMNWKKALNISFKVYVPKDVSTELHTSGGSINLNNLNGEQDFATSGGSLHVDGVSGKINGKTSGGSVHVSNSHDDIDLSTSGGSIEAKNCDGELRLNTSGGSLRLDDLKGNIKANTSGGSIRGGNVQGELITHTSGGSITLNALACSLETSTNGGSINVDFASLGKYVRISNNGGDINLQLPSGKGYNLDLAGRKIDTGTLNNFSGSVENDRVSGKLTVAAPTLK